MILITGGLGSIGAHTATALLALGESVVLCQRSAARVPSFLTGQPDHRVAFAEADCTDLDAVLDIGRRYEITGVVHLAAAGLEIAHPVDFLRANTACLLNVLQAARTWGVRRMSFASSIGVYLGVTEHPWRETGELPLAATHTIPVFKKAAELFAAMTAQQLDLDVVTLRIGTIWGPLGDPDSPFFPVPRLINAAARGEQPDLNPPRPVGYADDGGDRCYVKDCGRAIALLMTTERLAHSVYNVSSGVPARNSEFAEAITSVLPGADVSLRTGRSPDATSGKDPHLDISRLRSDTGYEPHYGVAAGVADYLAWLRAGNAR
jgi:UDP-glucose 4-epimerase